MFEALVAVLLIVGGVLIAALLNIAHRMADDGR